MPLLETRGSGSAIAFGLNAENFDKSSVVTSLSGLRLYVDAREYNSTLWKDLSGSGNHMIPRNNPTFTTTNGNKNVQFRKAASSPDTNSQYAYCINTMNDIQYITIESYFSVEGNSSPNQIFYNKENTYELSTGSNQFQYAWQTVGVGWDWNTITSLTQGQKIHMVETWGTDHIKRTYINGTLVQNGRPSSMNTAPLAQDKNTYFKLNARNDAQLESGDAGNHNIYRCAIWNRALSQQDVTALRNDAIVRHGS
jgi:hypothetical protein